MVDQVPSRPFGPDDRRTWTDVASHVRRILGHTFRMLDPETMQDVLQEVIVDLIGYWSDLPSARHADGSFSFRWAVQRGCWVGKRAAFAYIQDNQHEHRVFFLLDDAGDDYFGIPDDAPTPEEAVLGDEEQQVAREMLAAFSPEELETYFVLLTGETSRELAEREGISQSTASRRVRKATARLREVAAEYGIA